MEWNALEADQHLDEEETLMTVAEMEAFMANLECSDCLDESPPLFSLPPPPPPPWLDTLPGCYGTGNCADLPVVTKTSVEGNVQDLVQTVAVIVVSSLVIVLTVLLCTAMLVRKWKASRKEKQEADEQMGEFSVTGKDLQSTMPRSTNLYISEQQLMVEVGRGMDGLPPPALVIGGVPFHLVQRRQEEPIYHSIDSEHYSDLSSLGSSLSSSGTSGRVREGGLEQNQNPDQVKVHEQLREVNLRTHPVPRVYYLRPNSSQSVQYLPSTQPVSTPEWRSTSLPGPWRPGPPCPAYANRPMMEEVAVQQEGAITSL